MHGGPEESVLRCLQSGACAREQMLPLVLAGFVILQDPGGSLTVPSVASPVPQLLGEGSECRHPAVSIESRNAVPTWRDCTWYSGQARRDITRQHT